MISNPRQTLKESVGVYYLFSADPIGKSMIFPLRTSPIALSVFFCFVRFFQAPYARFVIDACLQPNASFPAYKIPGAHALRKSRYVQYPSFDVRKLLYLLQDPPHRSEKTHSPHWLGSPDKPSLKKVRAPLLSGLREAILHGGLREFCEEFYAKYGREGGAAV